MVKSKRLTRPGPGPCSIIPFPQGPGLCLPAYPAATRNALTRRAFASVRGSLQTSLPSGAGFGFRPGLKMATRPRKQRLSSKASRALEMLASRPVGVAEQLLIARGFSRRILLGLIREGFAILTYERGRAGVKMQITAAGRIALVAEK